MMLTMMIFALFYLNAFWIYGAIYMVPTYIGWWKSLFSSVH